MSVSIRLSRGGAKKRPYYKIVVSNSRAPRDGKYLEQVGTYNPILAKDDENRVAAWVERLCADWGYAAEISGIGKVDEALGAPTQMAIFRRAYA